LLSFPRRRNRGFFLVSSTNGRHSRGIGFGRGFGVDGIFVEGGGDRPAVIAPLFDAAIATATAPATAIAIAVNIAPAIAIDTAIAPRPALRSPLGGGG